MKISLNWLSDFVDLTVTDPEEISRRVTAGDTVGVVAKLVEGLRVT